MAEWIIFACVKKPDILYSETIIKKSLKPFVEPLLSDTPEVRGLTQSH